MTDKKMITCPNCFGKGEVRLSETVGSPRTPQHIHCRICGGTGKIRNERR